MHSITEMLVVEQPGCPDCPLVRGNRPLKILKSTSGLVLPLYWRQCNASIWCNARCLILDFKVLLQVDMTSIFPEFSENQTNGNGHINTEVVSNPNFPNIITSIYVGNNKMRTGPTQPSL
jgi:hypothetical protein